MPRRSGKPNRQPGVKGPHRPVRRAMLQFVMRSVTAVVVIGLATFFEARHMSERTAIEDARAHGEAVAQVIAAPIVNAAVRAHDPAATAALEQVMLHRVLGKEIVHMKLWDVDGTVIWSDEKVLVGQRFRLEKPVRQLAGGSFVHAELSDLSHPENALESDTGKLLEVYVGTKDADGVPMIFETYWSADGLHADQQQLLWLIAPLSLGALLLLLLLMVPLGVVLARTSTGSIRQRNRMLNHALSAADLERRRISQVLHDRVIQDLAGLGYALPSAAEQLAEGSAVRAVLNHATALVREDVTALRTMLVDIYPPALARGQLAPAIHELAARAEESGLVVVVEVVAAKEPALESSQLVYRIVREGLLNVVEHAAAGRSWVTVVADEHGVYVSVRDDGNAPVATIATADQESGHFGLMLLRDAVADMAGTLVLSTPPGGGTLLVGSFPAALLLQP